MPNPGDIKYCELLGGRDTNAAFVYIPPGSCWIGIKHDWYNPVYFVVITKGFWLQQTPFTNAQGHKVKQSTRSNDRPMTATWTFVTDLIQKLSNQVTLRLPTSAEWEYAAQANNAGKYDYSGSNKSDHVAWTTNNSKNNVQSVAKLKSNAFNLFDMTGNVTEWCSDWFGELKNLPQINPEYIRPMHERVLRGGSYALTSQPTDTIRSARPATMCSAAPYIRVSDIGFRLIWETQDA